MTIVRVREQSSACRTLIREHGFASGACRLPPHSPSLRRTLTSPCECRDRDDQFERIDWFGEMHVETAGETRDAIL